MATGVGWAAISAHFTPSLKVSRDNTVVASASAAQADVYSFLTQYGRVNAPAVLAPTNSLSLTPGDLVEELKSGIMKPTTATPTIGGQPARVTQVQQVESNNATLLSTLLESNHASAVVQYDLRIRSGKNGARELVFEPLSATAIMPKFKGK
ncbi:MAG TPA: hypothetical protein VGR92_03555 [Steroidobacteraceae bacterium]|nr:hypothetical protein [Steroidobacteraceae bacterium]